MRPNVRFQMLPKEVLHIYLQSCPFSKKSTFSFLDMCWEIYCKDLFQQYDKNDEILNLIASSLNKKISNSKKDDEDIQLGSKVYGFRAGIKGLAIEKQDLLKELLDEAFETMNHLTNDEPIKVETYFASLIKNGGMQKQVN